MTLIDWISPQMLTVKPAQGFTCRAAQGSHLSIVLNEHLEEDGAKMTSDQVATFMGLHYLSGMKPAPACNCVAQC